MRTGGSHSLLGLAALVITACSYDIQKRQFPEQMGGSISYAVINETVFKPNCLSCHGSSHEPLLGSYSQVKTNIEKIQRVVFTTKSMPKGGRLSNEELSLLQTWIANGAQELPSLLPPPPVTDRPVVLWTELQNKVVKPKCLACHFSQNPGNLSDLQDIELFRAAIGTILFISVAKSTMPPPPLGTPEESPNPNQLSRNEKDLLSHWVTDGMRK